MPRNGRKKPNPYARFVKARSRERAFKKASGALDMKKIGRAWRAKKAGRKSPTRRSTRKGQRRKTARRAYMPRRKARSTRKKSRDVNIGLVSTALAVALPVAILNSADVTGKGFNAIPELKQGMYKEALEQTVANLKLPTTQNKIIKLALGGLLLKGVADRLNVGKVASLGPVKMFAR